jgi:TrmH family RNA methyltransferase
LSTKAELKRVRSLHQRKYRESEGCFLVQGAKLVGELLGSGWEAEAIYATEEAAQRSGLRQAVVLPAHEMERLGTLESGNELLGVVRMPDRALPVAPGAGELVLVLDGVADPGNLGTILRVADWFGLRQVLCSTGSVDVYNPKCVQASMGAIFRVAVGYDELAPRLDAWRSAGTHLYLASMEGRPVFELSLQRPAALVLGSESHGISPAVRALGGELLSVPRLGGAESLNVAMAASALCMEFTRQR